MHWTAGHLILLALIPLLAVRMINFMRRGMRVRWAIVMIALPLLLGGISSFMDVRALNRQAADAGISVPPETLRTALEPAWLGVGGAVLLTSVLLILLGLRKRKATPADAER